jgi:hypothetical protein
MSKYIVQAVQREGFRGVWRAGREWQHTPVEVEVLDQEEDPTTEVVDPNGKKRQALDATRIGRKSWAAMMADGRISKTPLEAFKATAVEGDIVKLRARVNELEGELDRAKTENQALKQAMEERVGPQPDSPVPFDSGGALRSTLSKELPPRAASDDALLGNRARAEAFVPPAVAERPMAPNPPATEAPARPPAGVPHPEPAIRGNVPAGHAEPLPGHAPSSSTAMTHHTQSPEIGHMTGGKKGK